MSTKKITIEVSEEIAQAYKNASPERRQRAQRAMAYALMPRGIPPRAGGMRGDLSQRPTAPETGQEE